MHRKLTSVASSPSFDSSSSTYLDNVRSAKNNRNKYQLEQNLIGLDWKFRTGHTQNPTSTVLDFSCHVKIGKETNWE
jgi:hypothetical protein